MGLYVSWERQSPDWRAARRQSGDWRSQDYRIATRDSRAFQAILGRAIEERGNFANREGPVATPNFSRRRSHRIKSAHRTARESKVKNRTLEKSSRMRHPKFQR
jgi:hypothetical protein